MHMQKYTEALEKLPQVWKDTDFSGVDGAIIEDRLFLTHFYLAPIVFNPKKNSWELVKPTGNIYNEHA